LIPGRERFSPWRGRVSCPCILAPFGVKEEVYLKILKRGLDKISVVCTYGSIDVCYILVNSMVHPEAIFLMYPQDYVTATYCRSRYWSYFLISLRDTVKYISERDVVGTCWSRSHHSGLTPDQLVN
jgi:hypothetical protein